MSARPPFAIVGAGIAGLTTALALDRAGLPSVTVERRNELSEAGAGIQLSPNCGRVLAALGLDEAIAAAATAPDSITVRNGLTGATTTALPVAAFGTRYGFPYRAIHRADLQAVLADAVRKAPLARLLLGTEVTAVSERGDSLDISISSPDGGEVIPAAGLVGADGVWSATRRRIPGSASARPTGRTAWRTVIPIDVAPPGERIPRVGLWLGPSAHVVVYPVAKGAGLNIVVLTEEAFDAEDWAVDAGDPNMVERFAGWCAELRALLATPSHWQKFPMHAVDPSGPWINGHIALVGDAAHAMVPFLAQGGAMAIEDAAVLARCLAASPDNVPAAFSAYEAARKPRVTRVWKSAFRNGEHYHQTGFMAAARDLVLRTAGPRVLLARNDWIYRWTPDA